MTQRPFGNPSCPGYLILERDEGEPPWQFEANVKAFLANGKYELAPDAVTPGADVYPPRQVVVRPTKA